MKNAYRLRSDIQHFVNFLNRDSLTIVWDAVSAELNLLPRHTWKRRGESWSGTPVDFVQKYYGEWQGDVWSAAGLTALDLKRDMPLYNAYRDWIRRHPEDNLRLPSSGPLAERQRQRLVLD